MSKPTHFLDLNDFTPEEIQEVFTLAKRMKIEQSASRIAGSVVGVFEKASPRTESALGVGIPRFGGNFVKLSGDITERPHHYARMLKEHFSAAVLRTVSHDKLRAIAEHSEIPIINGLTDASHPCLVLADMLTIGEPKGLKIAFIGSATNVAKTYAQAAPLFGFSLALGMPKREHEKIQGSEFISHYTDPFLAAENADVVVTDQWGSAKDTMTSYYTVNARLMNVTKDDAIFMHPMPLSSDQHEATLEVVDGSQSRVFEQTGNRIYGFAAAITWCLK